MIGKMRAKYIAGKVLQLIAVMMILSIIVFALARLAPGDPLRSYYGDGVEHMSTAQKEAAISRLGMDAPLPEQYVKWLGNALHGDFGISYKYKQPVTMVISRVWTNTLLLGGLAFLLTFLFSFMLGMYTAMREGSLADRIITKVGVVSNSIPAFFMGLMLILFFAVKIPLFPTGGAYALGEVDSISSRIYHMILPLTVLVLEHLWYYTYMVRNKLSEEVRKDYVLMCKAKGLSRKTIMRRHCLRNIMPSMVTIMAIALPHILGGTYVVEMVFSYPGLGSLSFESAKYHDYNMLMVLSLLTGLVVVVFNMIAQIVDEKIDPRTAYERNVPDELK